MKNVLLASSLVLNFLLLGAGLVVVNRHKQATNFVANSTFVSAKRWYDGRRGTYEMMLPKSHDIIFLGDSLTDFGDWASFFGKPILNCGIEKDTVQGVISRIDPIVKAHPRKIFLMIGTNNVLGANDTQEVIASYHGLISKIRSSSPQTQLFLESVLPLRASNSAEPISNPDQKEKAIVAINQFLKQSSNQKNVVYVDLYSAMVDPTGETKQNLTSDGVHMSDEGYQVWIDKIRPYIQ